MAKRECISLRRVMQIAYGTAARTGLTPPTREAITQMYLQKPDKLKPIITLSENGQMWVDKYYVAYQLIDEPVHYTYISVFHIREEVTEYRLASRERKNRIRLPEDIRRCFETARAYIRRTGTPYWIDREWRDEKKIPFP